MPTLPIYLTNLVMRDLADASVKDKIPMEKLAAKLIAEGLENRIKM